MANTVRSDASLKGVEAAHTQSTLKGGRRGRREVGGTDASLKGVEAAHAQSTLRRRRGGGGGEEGEEEGLKRLTCRAPGGGREEGSRRNRHMQGAVRRIIFAGRGRVAAGIPPVVPPT